MFDIKDFYTSIKERLLWEAIRFAKRYISVTSKDIEAIFHGRKSFLHYNNKRWVKTGESHFDIIMKAYDEAEVCELIGIFMLPLFSKHIIKNHVGLHRDDGLTILKNTCGLEAEKLKTKFQKLFKEKDVDIIVRCNLKTTNYLDIAFNLNDGLYRSYRKPNEETNYIYQTTGHQSLKKFHEQSKN